MNEFTDQCFNKYNSKFNTKKTVMKKNLLLIIAFLFISISSEAQLLVTNNTPSTLLVGVQSRNDTSPMCWGFSETPMVIPPFTYNVPYTLTVPYDQAYRIGCAQVVSLMPLMTLPGSESWEICPNYLATISAIDPCGLSSFGPYNFTWNGCNYVEITP